MWVQGALYQTTLYSNSCEQLTVNLHLETLDIRRWGIKMHFLFIRCCGASSLNAPIECASMQHLFPSCFFFLFMWNCSKLINGPFLWFVFKYLSYWFKSNLIVVTEEEEPNFVAIQFYSLITRRYSIDCVRNGVGKSKVINEVINSKSPIIELHDHSPQADILWCWCHIVIVMHVLGTSGPTSALTFDDKEITHTHRNQHPIYNYVT